MEDGPQTLLLSPLVMILYIEVAKKRMMLPVVVSSPVKMAIWALFGVAYEVARS
jgi:hypothetical protein